MDACPIHTRGFPNATKVMYRKQTKAPLEPYVRMPPGCLFREILQARPAGRTQGQTQKMLEGLHIPSAPGMGDGERDMEAVAWETDAWAALLSLLPLHLAPG